MDETLRENFHDKMMNLMYSMKRFHMFSHRHLNSLQDVTRGRGRILALLKIQENMTTKDLGYLLGIRQQSLNESLKRLENDGYISRKPDKNDRRIIRIQLTEKGKNFKQVQNNSNDVLADFSDDELRQFGSYVDRLCNAYDKYTSTKYDSEDEARFDQIQDHMEAMRESMGSDHFDQMMERCQRMGMPMSMGMMMHHHNHHGFGCGHHCSF